MGKILFLAGLWVVSIPAFAVEALIFYGDLNNEENHLKTRQALESAIQAQGLTVRASYGKDQPYPPDYYYWRFVVDVTGREDAYAFLRSRFHQKDLYGFKILVDSIDSYLTGHALIGRDRKMEIILQSNNFDLKSFSLLSEADAYTGSRAEMFQNAFWTDFLDYVEAINPPLANLLIEKKPDLYEILLAHAVTMRLGEGNEVSYRVHRFYNIVGD